MSGKQTGAGEGTGDRLEEFRQYRLRMNEQNCKRKPPGHQSILQPRHDGLLRRRAARPHQGIAWAGGLRRTAL